uniref:hypothetical protein n=1 Tax=Agathobacter rectalis TaxID=39491 RepID=UPI0040281399
MRKIGFANSQNGTLVGRFPPLTTYPEKIPNFGIDYREEYFFLVAAIAIFEDYQTNQLVKKVVKEMEVVTDIELSSMEDGKVYALENRMDYEYTVGIKYGGKLYLMQMDEYMGKPCIRHEEEEQIQCWPLGKVREFFTHGNESSIVGRNRRMETLQDFLSFSGSTLLNTELGKAFRCEKVHGSTVLPVLQDRGKIRKAEERSR